MRARQELDARGFGDPPCGNEIPNILGAAAVMLQVLVDARDQLVAAARVRAFLVDLAPDIGIADQRHTAFVFVAEMTELVDGAPVGMLGLVHDQQGAATALQPFADDLDDLARIEDPDTHLACQDVDGAGHGAGLLVQCHHVNRGTTPPELFAGNRLATSRIESDGDEAWQRLGKVEGAVDLGRSARHEERRRRGAGPKRWTRSPPLHRASASRACSCSPEYLPGSQTATARRCFPSGPCGGRSLSWSIRSCGDLDDVAAQVAPQVDVIRRVFCQKAGRRFRLGPFRVGACAHEIDHYNGSLAIALKADLRLDMSGRFFFWGTVRVTYRLVASGRQDLPDGMG